MIAYSKYKNKKLYWDYNKGSLLSKIMCIHTGKYTYKKLKSTLPNNNRPRTYSKKAEGQRFYLKNSTLR